MSGSEGRSDASIMEQDLAHIRENLLRMYRYVRKIVEKAIEALENCSKIDLEDKVALAGELRDLLEDQATLFIAKYQPLGRELLEAKAFIRVSYDLYRIARYAREITLLIDFMETPMRTSEKVVKTARLALAMLDKAFEAYTKRDERIIREVNAMDRQVDEEYYNALKKIAKSEMLYRRDACNALILRHIERMADHTVYIASSFKDVISPPKL